MRLTDGWSRHLPSWAQFSRSVTGGQRLFKWKATKCQFMYNAQIVHSTTPFSPPTFSCTLSKSKTAGSPQTYESMIQQPIASLPTPHETVTSHTEFTRRSCLSSYRSHRPPSTNDDSEFRGAYQHPSIGYPIFDRPLSSNCGTTDGAPGGRVLSDVS
jgi:hypothetical protein